MIISCEQCQKRYRLGDDVFSRGRVKVKCSQCAHVFIVEKPDSQEPAPIVLGEDHAVTDEPTCQTITVCNQKGGVAKTSTCLNLAASLALMKKRVLVIDFDVQANLSMLLGFTNTRSFFDVLHSGDEDIEKYVLNTKLNFWVLPSNPKMALLSKKHLSQDNYEYLLRDKLERIKKLFDYILIDTPPSGDFYTLNALLCSDLALVPSTCEYLSMNGVRHVEDLVNVIRDKVDYPLDIRVLVTQFQRDNTASRVVLEMMRKRYGDKLLKTIIEYDVKIQESQIVRKPVLYYDKSSSAGRQYHRLANELLSSVSAAVA